MKIIRQPFIVDRLIVSEINKDGALVGLAMVYLNEYRVASTAFSLHSHEPKVLKIWREQISKAKEVYEEAKTASSSTRNSESEVIEDSNFLTSTSAQRGSYRGSRISSVVHSNSGSMDLMDLPTGFRREVSLELSHGCSAASLALEPNRASSLSSEEGSGPVPASNSLDSKSQSSYPSSPRAERKGLRTQNPPNTLTVQIPYGPAGGVQTSAPQTPIAADHSARTGSPFSSRGMGISYPPLSPKSSLRRSKAVTAQQSISKNPPLAKSRQVSASDGITIPVITASSEGQEEVEHLEEKAIEATTQPAAVPTGGQTEEKQGRKGRTDRADARRYHTAGAIEDIKV